MPTTLYYFPVKGRAQQIRLALSEANITWQEGGYNLPQLKADGIATFGSIPAIIHDGVKVVHGTNCAFYIAQKYGFGGSTIEETTEINQFVLAAEDFRIKVYEVRFGKSTVEAFLAADGAGPRWFTCLNNLLEGKEYFCHDKFSIADICIYDALTGVTEGLKLDFNDYTNLKNHYDRIEARPAIAALKNITF